MVRTLKTSRQDIYKRLVSSSGDDPEGGAGDAIFKYNYELFSLGAIHGFLNGERRTDYDTMSQDFTTVSNIGSDEHRQTIDLVHQMVKIETGKTDESEIWEAVLEYADGGVELINELVKSQGDFDLVGVVEDAETEAWEPRLIEAIGDPQELEGVRPRK